MTDHYYTQQTDVQHDRNVALKWNCADKLCSLLRMQACFSKSGIDYGSKLLIETMEIPKTRKCWMWAAVMGRLD